MKITFVTNSIMMKASRIISFVVLLLLQTVSTIVSAQKAGDVITGVITDDEGPLMMINVTERDSSDRIVAHTITDIDGTFSFKLVNPHDRILITHVGYQVVDTLIDKLHFDIRLKEADELPPVLITARRSQETGPMPIPRPVAWQKITGYISDKTGPLELANVEEIDEKDQIVAQSITDKRGYFSFTLMDPDHHIKVSCNGYETVEYPIDRTYFDIMLKKQKNVPQENVNTEAKVTTK